MENRSDATRARSRGEVRGQIVSPIGSCALCKEIGVLRNSHLVPKALFRLARASYSRNNPNPVLLTSVGRQQTSFQACQFLLCGACESGVEVFKGPMQQVQKK